VGDNPCRCCEPVKHSVGCWFLGAFAFDENAASRREKQLSQETRPNQQTIEWLSNHPDGYGNMPSGFVIRRLQCTASFRSSRFCPLPSSPPLTTETKRGDRLLGNHEADR
jgi:hypothetical protein